MRRAPEPSVTEPDLDIRLLGPVHVLRQGSPVELPSTRPAVILAALALQPGAVVTPAALSEWLWPDVAPTNPRAAVQTYVTRLRAVLGRDVIAFAHGGYRLEPSACGIDIVRFRAGVLQAGATTDPAAQLTTLQAALSSWTGRPLSGLTPGELSRMRAPAIVAELVDAAERVGDLHLRLQPIDDAFVRSVRQLVREHPGRERLWAQLMVALCRLGRQADALGVFHEAVGVLRRHYGRRPGAHLVGIHRQIVTADPELIGRRTTDPGASASLPPQRLSQRPAQLPARPSDFVGRAEELATLTAALSTRTPGPLVVAISGAGGSGKTTLALRLAHEVRPLFPDGQLFADLRGADPEPRTQDAPAALLRALGVAGSDVPAFARDQAALFRLLCSGRRMLILLDDVAAADEVTALLSADSGCGVVVTSRRRLPGLRTDARVDVGSFDHDEAHKLFSIVVGDGRLADEPEALDQLIECCGGSPLAVRIAAGRLASRPSWPIEHLATRLHQGNRLDELEAGGIGVRTMLAASYASLDPTSAWRYRLLAVMPGTSIDVDTASVVWDVSSTAALATLRHLADIRVLEPADAMQYEWHDLVGAHIQTVVTPDERRSARDRLVAHLVATLQNAHRRLRPGDTFLHDVRIVPHATGRGFRNRAEIHGWLHRRAGVLLALCREELATAAHPSVDRAAALLVLLDSVARECCDSSDGEATSRAVLDAAEPPQDRRLVACAWNNLTLAMAARRRLSDALDAGEHAIELQRELGDRRGEYAMYENVASVYLEAHRYQEAADVLASVDRDESPLSPQLQARTLRTRARALAGLGHVARADADVRAAARLHDPDTVSYDAHYLAVVEAAVHRQAGRRSAALAACRRALAVAVALESSWMRSLSLVDLAHTQRIFDGDGRDAAASGLATARRHHHIRLEADALMELADCADRTDPIEAARCRREARDLLVSSGADIPPELRIHEAD